MFVGKNADKYLSAFRKFNKDGGDSFAATWHWPAFFFSFWWMIYRKMYVWAFLILLLGCVPFLGIVLMILFGMSGNYLYYNHAKKKLLALEASPLSEIEKAAAIGRAGGVNNIAVIVAPLSIIFLAIIAAIAIPQFAEYRRKAADIQARTELQDACRRGAELFAVDSGKIEIEPDELLHAGLVRTAEVDMVLLDGRKERFSISAKHNRGGKIYFTDRACALAEESLQN